MLELYNDFVITNIYPDFSYSNDFAIMDKVTKEILLNNSARIINIKSNNSLGNTTTIELSNCFKNQLVNIKISENLILKHYIPAHLKYTNLQYCLLVEPTQFVDSYTIIGYFESLIVNSLEIVKFKSKQLKKKQIFLISNKDCITVNKEERKNKIVNELIIDNIKVNQTGKIIIDNGQFLTIQKGRPYFFPNCLAIFSSNSTVRGPNPANHPSLRHSSTALISSSPYASNLLGAYHIFFIMFYIIRFVFLGV